MVLIRHQVPILTMLIIYQTIVTVAAISILNNSFPRFFLLVSLVKKYPFFKYYLAIIIFKLMVIMMIINSILFNPNFFIVRPPYFIQGLHH